MSTLVFKNARVFDGSRRTLMPDLTGQGETG